MSTFQSPIADIALMLTSASGSTIDTTMFTLSGMKAHDGSVSTKNTEAWVEFNAAAPLTGRVKVYYDRLNLRSLGNFTFTRQSADPGVSVYTILDIIRNQTGITFGTDDLVDHAVVDTGTVIQVYLEAKTTSIGFTANYTLTLKPYPDISTLFTNNALVSF